MESLQKTYLQFIDFSQFSLWNVKNYFGDTLNFNFEKIKLKDILSKADIEWVNIENEKEYPILGVRAQGQGVYMNRTAKGSELTMRKYQKSKVGTLFYCKVRTVNGQWGIVYPEYENSYGSSNMQYLDVDTTKISLHFLELLLTIKRLTNKWDENKIGADGRHFTLNTLLSLEIPLPSLTEQNRIVELYNLKIQESAQSELRATELEKEIETYLIEELGIEVEEKSEKKGGLKFLDFEILQRWDVKFLLGSLPSISSKYSIEVFSDIIKNLNKGPNLESIRINPFESPQKEFRYIGMEHIEKETGKLLEMQEVEGKEIKSQAVKIPKGYIIFGKLRPYLNKYWINYTDYNNIICSSEFLVFDINEGINKEFFKYCLSSSFVQYQITDKTSGARMPRINEDIFMNLQIPLPPLEIQEKIVKHITEIKDEIKRLKQHAEELMESAKEDFEKEIFS